MENIKLYINASTEDVKLYLNEAIKLINTENREINTENKITNNIPINSKNINNNSWIIINGKITAALNKTNNNNTIIYLKIIKFLLFGKEAENNAIEQYDNSIYSTDIFNFSNCLLIIIIQIFIYKINITNISDLINIINRIIKCSYIIKSIHVIKSLINKNNYKEIDTFIFTLFYFIYKKYQKNFIGFLSSEICDIKQEYKKLLLNEYYIFDYNEKSVMYFNNMIFEIKLSYSLLGVNPDDVKIEKFLSTIQENKVKQGIQEIFKDVYYKKQKPENIVNLDNGKNEKNNAKILYKKNKDKKLCEILKEIQNIKVNLNNVKKDIQELKTMQDNYMNDIYRVLNFMDK